MTQPRLLLSRRRKPTTSAGIQNARAIYGGPGDGLPDSPGKKLPTPGKPTQPVGPPRPENMPNAVPAAPPAQSQQPMPQQPPQLLAPQNPQGVQPPMSQVQPPQPGMKTANDNSRWWNWYDFFRGGQQARQRREAARAIELRRIRASSSPGYALANRLAPTDDLAADIARQNTSGGSSAPSSAFTPEMMQQMFPQGSNFGGTGGSNMQFPSPTGPTTSGGGMMFPGGMGTQMPTFPQQQQPNIPPMPQMSIPNFSFSPPSSSGPTAVSYGNNWSGMGGNRLANNSFNSGNSPGFRIRSSAAKNSKSTMDRLTAVAELKKVAEASPFVAGFLVSCVEQGIPEERVEQLVKQASNTPVIKEEFEKVAIPWPIIISALIAAAPHLYSAIAGGGQQRATSSQPAQPRSTNSSFAPLPPSRALSMRATQPSISASQSSSSVLPSSQASGQTSLLPQAASNTAPGFVDRLAGRVSEHAKEASWKNWLPLLLGAAGAGAGFVASQPHFSRDLSLGTQARAFVDPDSPRIGPILRNRIGGGALGGAALGSIPLVADLIKGKKKKKPEEEEAEKVSYEITSEKLASAAPLLTGFLVRCQEKQLSPDQTVQMLKQAAADNEKIGKRLQGEFEKLGFEKEAFWNSLVGWLAKLGPWLAQWRQVPALARAANIGSSVLTHPAARHIGGGAALAGGAMGVHALGSAYANRQHRNTADAIASINTAQDPQQFSQALQNSQLQLTDPMRQALTRMYGNPQLRPAFTNQETTMGLLDHARTLGRQNLNADQAYSSLLNQISPGAGLSA